MALRDVLERLNDSKLRQVGEGRWVACCKGHADTTPSLSITRGTGGRVLLKCWAGCDTEHVVQSMGLEMTALFDGERTKHEAKETLHPDRWPVTATSVYRDAKGDPLFRVLRKTSPDSGAKTFRQERWKADEGWHSGMDGVERVLYRLPQLMDPETTDDLVLIVEGERDADLLISLGLLATTNPGGAGKWLSQYSETLKGRNVVILPDNDPPGDAHAKLVSAALTNIAASVKILKLPELPEKGDVSDWFGRGGTKDQLLALVLRAGEGPRFLPSSLRIEGERGERIENAKHILSYGIKFLDDALGGITLHDLVMIGAKTGRGKTKAATTIALANCRAGKTVHYFALEAEDREMERRMKYEVLAGYYYANSFQGKKIRYLDWYNGKLDFDLARYEDRAEEEVRILLKNLHTYYTFDDFTSKEFLTRLAEIQADTDLVLLDHFHYVTSEDSNELRGQKRLVKQIRDGALRAGKPVVIVGHVKKADARYEPLVPNEEAFSGTKDLANIMTKVIMIAPDYETTMNHPSLWSTYFQISKCRQDSSLTRYLARLSFDIRKDAYEDGYELGRMTNGGMAFSLLAPGDVPDWALSASNRKKAPDQQRHFMDA